MDPVTTSPADETLLSTPIPTGQQIYDAILAGT